MPLQELWDRFGDDLGFALGSLWDYFRITLAAIRNHFDFMFEKSLSVRNSDGGIDLNFGLIL